MNELTIKEKAKAYDEALHKAKRIINVCVDDNTECRSMIACIQEIFTELKESEDYEIRNAIKEAVITLSDSPLKNKCLAWLEKQSKHKKFRDSIQVGDKVTRNEDGLLVNLSQLNRVAKKDEKQCEKKPVGLFDKELAMIDKEYNRLERLKQKPEQKPAWSEEDEKQARQIERIVSNDGCTKQLQEQIHNWFKSLKGRVLSKQEWSEDDKDNIFNIVGALDILIQREAEKEHNGDRNASPKYYSDLQDWLKSLRPQKINPRFPQYENIVDKVFGAGNLESWEYEEAEMLVALAKEELLKDIQKPVEWRPSKEVMDVLYSLCYITNVIDDHKDAVLIKLYQDLKREFFNGTSYENMFQKDENIKIKSSKWNEEDEKKFNSLIDLANFANEIWSKKYKEEFIDWLKSLRPQSQQEWSEDNIKEFKAELQSLMFEWSNKKDNMGVCIDRHIDKLLSILWNHTQSHWKPSKAQIEAVEKALSFAKNCGEESAFDLRTLYEQLKKLREE